MTLQAPSTNPAVRALSLPLVSHPLAVQSVEAFLAQAEYLRQIHSVGIGAEHRTKFGQYFTPASVAKLLAEMVRLPTAGLFRVLDPGAGTGSLTAALIARIARERPGLSVSICTVELDHKLVPSLQEMLRQGRQLIESHGGGFEAEIVNDDIVALSTGWSRTLFDRFDLVLANPPYRKLGTASIEFRALAALGINSPNLYSSFLAIGALALTPGGQLVAITPRSFANGSYFAPFRRFFLSRLGFDSIHVFESRSSAFGDTGVLQENVIFSARKGAPGDTVLLSSSHGATDQPQTRSVAYEEVVRPDDRRQVIHIPVRRADTEIASLFATLPHTLAETGLEVSTGKVVDFRAKEHLLAEPKDPFVPLIYPGNLRHGRVTWPRSIRKPIALAATAETSKLILPNERFVLTRRFSAKEERRRVVAALYEPADVPGEGVGFENHLNVFHFGGRGLERNLAYGLCLWLNSSAVDRYFRTFSGHTQVNAADLRSLPYPSISELEQLGSSVTEAWPDQDAIDWLVSSWIFTVRG